VPAESYQNVKLGLLLQLASLTMDEDFESLLLSVCAEDGMLH
jgi:hypothetical protein